MAMQKYFVLEMLEMLEMLGMLGMLGMQLILQQNNQEDFVLVTGHIGIQIHMFTVKEFIEKAFGLNSFNISWKDKGVNKIGYYSNTGKELIFIDHKYFRPAKFV